MITGWRIAKVQYHPYDGAGAWRRGSRWNSPGREVIYASDSFAGAILETLAHAVRPRTLPGPHRAVRIDVPEELVERLEPIRLSGWDARESAAARNFGDTWLEEGRTPVLIVPSVPARPIGRTLIVNPHHPEASAIEVSEPFRVPWDERL
ncbi:MAG: RES family NAD+ phosphorylase [Actinomycetota bacterium]